MGHVRSKFRSLGQILEKRGLCSRDQIFSPLNIKLGQNVCLNKTAEDFENGSCRVKNQVTRSNLQKPSVHSRGHILSLIIMKHGQNVFLDAISDVVENWSSRCKN